MNQRRLGRTNLNVSELCLGTMNFGRGTSDDTCLDILDSFYAADGNFIQSIGISRGWDFSGPPAAFSESIVGRWWRSRAIHREHLVLATRLSLCRPEQGGTNAFHAGVRESVEDSLRRLQTDSLDLLVCDWHGGLLPIEDTLDAFDLLIRNGLVRHVAASNFPMWRIADAINRSRLEFQHRIEALQADYSLITRSGFEEEARDLCREYGIGFIACSPLAGGFLIKRDSAGLLLNSTRRRWLNQRYANGYADTVFSAVSEVAAARNATPAQMGVAWVLDHADVSSALVGVTSTAQLAELVEGTSMNLSFHECVTLDEATALQGLRV